MNKDTNILKKILAIQIQQYMKKIIHYDQVGFILEIQGFFKIHKSINMAHHIKKLKNHMIISVDVEKAWQNSIHIYDKGSPESGHRRKYLNIIKATYGKQS